MGAKLDLIGQQYGRLTVTAPAENIGGRTAWRCRCECGNELVTKTSYLRSGKVKSCGCLCGVPGQTGTRAGRGHPEGLSVLHYVDGTCVEMLRKNTVRRNNTSGVPGVEWRKSKRCWRASICFKGQRVYLGSYERFDDAVQARKLAEEQTHGAFLAYIDALAARESYARP